MTILKRDFKVLIKIVSCMGRAKVQTRILCCLAEKAREMGGVVS